MERTSVENLKEMIRAGRGKIPADKVIKGGQLVNVMSARFIRRILRFTRI